jgi:hypothetical protein
MPSPRPRAICALTTGPLYPRALARQDRWLHQGSSKDSSFFEDIEVSLIADSPVAVVFAHVTVLLKAVFELFRSRAENLLTSATAPNSGTERAVEQANNRISPCFSRDNRWQGRGDRFHQTASTTIQSWRIEVVSRLERIVVISMAWLYPKRSAVGISLISARSAPGSGRQSLAAKFRFPDQQMVSFRKRAQSARWHLDVEIWEPEP